MASNTSSLLEGFRATITAVVAGSPATEPGSVTSHVAREALGEMLDEVAGVEATIATLHAVRAELLDRARRFDQATAPAVHGPGSEMTERIFRAELATTLRVSERYADDMIHTAETLVERVPCTLAELRAGTISYAHAREIVNACWALEERELAEFEDAVVPVACEKTVSALKRKLRQLKDALAPETLVERHRKARAERHVSLTPADDGMAWLTAYLPVVQAKAIHTRLTDTAKSLRASGEPRTRAQLMADVFRDVLLDEHVPLTVWAGEDPMIRAFRTGRYGEGAWATGGGAGNGSRGSDPASSSGPVFTSGVDDDRDTDTDFTSSSGPGSGPDRVDSPSRPRDRESEPEPEPGDSGLDPRYFDLGFDPPGPGDDDSAPPGSAAPDETRARYRGIRARVNVTVPVMTLLGKEDAPGMLDGTIPIDPDTAHELAAHAPSFTRLLTHPETGVVLSVGRDSYRPPEPLRAWIRLRDNTCTFPGCTTSAEHTEIDHVEDWAHGGGTSYENLQSLCTGHHKLKHASNWSVRGHPDIPGAFVWASPLGKEHTTYPAQDLPTPAA